MKRIKEINLDFYIYIGFILLGIFILWQASDLKQDSALFPQLLSYLLLFLSFLLLIFNFHHQRHLLTKQMVEVTKKSKISQKEFKVYYELYPFLIVLVCIFFIWGFQYIGFDFSAFMAMLIIMLFMNRKEALKKFYWAIFIPLAVIFLFKVGLKLRLPLLFEKLF